MIQPDFNPLTNSLNMSYLVFFCAQIYKSMDKQIIILKIILIMSFREMEADTDLLPQRFTAQ